jgi:hypothetical protein
MAGCGPSEHVRMLEDKNAALEDENRQLAREIESVSSENLQLQKQVQTLNSLSEDVRIESLYKLETVKLTRYTNFYDRDKDGQKEKLIVYIQPIDSQGDLIKASGSVEVELWDLDADSDEAMLARWQIGPDELKEMWFAAIMTNYRFVFDISEIVYSFDKDYTVKMTFTDYVSGKVFNSQHVIKP